MGNIASSVCIAGAAAVVIIAKPACEYTVKLVLESTSLIVKNRLESVEADVKKAIKLIEETNESLDIVKQAIANGKSENSEMVLKAIDNIVKKDDTLPNRMSKMEEMMLKTADSITTANEAVNALPAAIDATAKKYSMYLHDEHASMFELMSGLCPSPAISPRSYASEGANRYSTQDIGKKDSFKNFNPAYGDFSSSGNSSKKGKGPSKNKNGKENF